MSKSMEESGSVSIYKEKWPIKKKNPANFMYRQKKNDRSSALRGDQQQ